MNALKVFFRKYPILIIVVFVLLAVGSLMWTVPAPVQYHNPAPENIRTNISFFENIGGDFTLINQDNQPISLSSLPAKPTLIYFGFTHCPDFCPTALQLFDTVDEDLGGNKINRVFVSIDPQRDSVDALKQYAKLYNKDLVLLTGTTAQVDEVAKKWKVFYTLNKKSPDDTDYTVDHITYSFLLNADKKLIAMIEADTPYNDIVSFIKQNNLTE